MFPNGLIGAILYWSIHYKHLIGTTTNPGKTTHTTESTVSLNIHTQVQMLIHVVLGLNWSNYLLKESIKGMLSILLTEFSKVNLNCMPFQLITKFFLACFKNGQKMKPWPGYSSQTHTVSALLNHIEDLCPFVTSFMVS